MPVKDPLVFATQNLNKIKEISIVLEGKVHVIGLNDLGQTGELPETGSSLEENAIQKARYVAEKWKVNCFADDTGLEIEALGGAPGVISARYAGEEKNAENNMNRVLLEMEGLKNRKACFRTVIALVWDGKSYLFEGKVEGNILDKKRGKAGFGYDPIFVPLNEKHTFAEMSVEEKNALSHRIRAVNKLVEFLNKR